MKFSLVLASRNRTHLLRNLIASIKKTANNLKEIELVVVCDEDDPQTRSFSTTEVNFKLLVRRRSSFMHRDYINWAYPHTSGDYIIVLNDDTEFVKPDWDLVNLDNVLYGFTETHTGNNLCCFPLLSRKAIDAQGFIMPNERKSWGADHDVYNVFNSLSVNGVTRVTEIEIKHVSYHTNSRTKDEINVRMQDIHDWNLTIPNGFYADRVSSVLQKKIDKDSKKVLVVYNICGINENENFSYYCQAINSILNQKFDNFRLIISGCLVDEKIKKLLHETFKDKISYLWVDDKYPLNITFNKAIKKGIEVFGNFEAYLYIDSGITLGQDRFVIQKMYNRIQKYAIVSAPVDYDDGYDAWGITMKNNEDYVIPVGKAVNLHCQMFSKQLFDNYNAVLPDIFASDTSESVFTFLCAAIGKKWVIAHDICLHHEFAMDGPSAGYRGKHALLYKTNKTIEQICEEGKPFGFGYEEIHGVCNHDKTKYSEDGKLLDDRLLGFLQNNMFLKNFNYDTISGSFFPQLISTKKIQSPQITCLLVSHNKPDYCKEAIDSVLSQELTDWQLIIIDSGVLYNKGFFEKYNDPRITIIPSGETTETKKTKAMAPWCFNECFRRNLIKSELIVYLCDDDYYYPNAFGTFVNYFEENPNCMCVHASQDTAIHTHTNKFISGERRAIKPIGSSQTVGTSNISKINCVFDYMQFCHKTSLLNNVLWSEEKNNELNADGIFFEKIGELIMIHSIDIKIGQNRRTPFSTYGPSK